MSLKIIIILFLPAYFYPQKAEYGKSERNWAFRHPFAAIKVKLISKKCYQIYHQGFIKAELDSFSNGGKLDAFRHIFFMAAFSKKIKIKKLRKLGEAHEKTNYKMFLNSRTEFNELPDSVDSVMDILNNEFAFKISSEIKKMSLQGLAGFVIEEIKNGKAFIMKRKKNGRYFDCNNKEINLQLYKNKWNVPKCLVTSDYIYMD